MAPPKEAAVENDGAPAAPAEQPEWMVAFVDDLRKLVKDGERRLEQAIALLADTVEAHDGGIAAHGDRLESLEQLVATGGHTSDAGGPATPSVGELAAAVDLGARRLDGVVTAIERALGIAIRHTLPAAAGEKPRGVVRVTGAESADSF